MRRLLFTAAVLLASSNAGLAQVSTMGSTAMGLSTTPGAIVTSPLNGPSPFSATTQPGAPDTTLAPVPLASDPTAPGIVVTCAPPTGQITPGTPTVSVNSTPVFAASTIAPTPTTSSASATDSTPAPFLQLSAQPASSFLSTVPGSTVPVSSSTIAIPAAPSATATPASTPSTIPSPVSAITPSTTTMSSTAMMPGTSLGTIPTSIIGSTTGTISPVSLLGSPSTTVCSSIPGGPPTNGAALPLSTPEVPSGPAPGAIQPPVAELASTSIDPTMAVMPTPNTSACAESVTMNLSTPGTMAPANATGAAATPGVSSQPPSGC